jgi:hypothetical protein
LHGHWTGGGEYKVSSTGAVSPDYSVDLKTRTCDYGRWQLTGIPCHHVLACWRTDMINPETLEHSSNSIETFKRAYAYNLHPLRGRKFWEKVSGVHVHPPLYTKVMGRPKKNRKKAPEEKLKKWVTTLSRHGVTMHSSICGRPDHNKKGHDNYMLRLQAETEENAQVWEDDADDPSILQVSYMFSIIWV